MNGVAARPISLERARLSVACGPLARALAGRFVAALAAETGLAVDRVDEAGLVAEALADRCGEVSPDGELALTVGVQGDELELRVGPLESGAAQRLLRRDAGYASGGAIRGLASSVEIRSCRGGTEIVRVVLTGARA